MSMVQLPFSIINRITPCILKYPVISRPSMESNTPTLPGKRFTSFKKSNRDKSAVLISALAVGKLLFLEKF